jgi:hypothetical protein
LGNFHFWGGRDSKFYRLQPTAVITKVQVILSILKCNLNLLSKIQKTHANLDFGLAICVSIAKRFPGLGLTTMPSPPECYLVFKHDFIILIQAVDYDR